MHNELQEKLKEHQAEKGYEVVGDDKAKAKKPQSEIAERDKKIGEFIKLYQEARQKEAEDYKRRQRNFDRSNLYMEEVASALVESKGDIGYGLSKGAAEAAKRISADEMAKEKIIQELKDKEAEANNEKIPMNLIASMLKASASVSEQSRQHWGTSLGVNEMLEAVESEIQKVSVAEIDEADPYDIPVEE